MVSEGNTRPTSEAIAVHRPTRTTVDSVWIDSREQATFLTLCRKYWGEPVPGFSGGIRADADGLTLCDEACDQIGRIVPWTALG